MNNTTGMYGIAGTAPQHLQGSLADRAVTSSFNQANAPQQIPSPGVSAMASELLPRLGQMSNRMQRVAQCLRQTPESGSDKCRSSPSDVFSTIQHAHVIVSYCEGVLSDIESSLGV